MRLHILGSRGVPARHGGFETFAEQFALFMVSRGHHVSVACQIEQGEPERNDVWKGIHRIQYAEAAGPRGTIRFDLRSALAASRDAGAVVLTLGYNTAIFSVLHRLRHVRHFMNMDGVEWRRQKWTGPQRLWLRGNEWCGAHLADRLIADHPAIKRHLSNLTNPEKITVIPYGADAVTEMSSSGLEALGLSPGEYYLVIARPEPENSMLEIVQAHADSKVSHPLVVLGRYTPETNAYHAKVLAAAKDAPVMFPGAIYERETVQALRFHARAYLHGHQVGGTNPSLVEALAAGNAVVAHRNPYNEWVAGRQAMYFSDISELTQLFESMDANPELLEPMRFGSRTRHQLCFRSELILEAYESLLMDAPLKIEQWSYGQRDALA